MYNSEKFLFIRAISDALEGYLFVFGKLFRDLLALVRIHEEAALNICYLVTVDSASFLCGTVTFKSVFSNDELPFAVLSLDKVAACAAYRTLYGIPETAPLSITQTQTVAVAVRAPAGIGIA